MTIRRVVLVALVLLAMQACARRSGVTESQAVQLPGFSIELPFGRVEKSTHLPFAGAHRVTVMPLWAESLPPRVRDFVQLNQGTVVVHWRAGAMTPEEERELRGAFVNSAARSIKGAVLKTTEEKGRWTALIGAGAHRLMMGGVYCPPGLSVYVNLALADPAGIEQQAQRVVQSVVCKVGPSIPQLPVLGLDLPPDYGRAQAPNKDSELYVSVHGTFLSVSPTDGDMVNSKAAVPVLNNLLGTLMQAPGSALDLRRESVARGDGQPAALFEARGSTGHPEGNALIVGVVYCQELELSYLLMMAGEGVNKSDASRITTTAKCPGHTGPPIRSAGDVLGEACDGGSGQACGYLSDLIAEHQVTDSPRTVTELRARACKLNAQLWCADSRAQ